MGGDWARNGSRKGAGSGRRTGGTRLRFLKGEYEKKKREQGGKQGLQMSGTRLFSEEMKPPDSIFERASL